ncbi:hypothetical protein [Variovorax sp. KK3]|uniref:hypothetical protein n=1 Tax=Variovorax sp. KK3 TaxID=1855728 RepID=UPI0015C3F886|nr:hypothetical protein [Variovorax sp. KK3]
MTPGAFDMKALEECVIVGGCHGLHCIPVAQQADYYRAQRLMAMLGLACLPVLVFLLC